MHQFQKPDKGDYFFSGVKKKHILVWFPILLIAINLILKFLFVTHTSIAGDEPFSIYHSQMDVSSIFDLMKHENNPPLHFLILHFWMKLFGISALSVRFLSVIFSSLTALIVYQIGNKFFSFRVGVIGSILFSFSNLNMLLAHEARVYALFGFLTAISMYLFLAICNDKSKRKYYMLLLITNVLILYSHYLGFFVIITQTTTVLLVKDIRNSVFKFYLIYLLLLICFYIPNILVFITRFSVSSQGTWVPKPSGITSIYEMLWSFSNQPVPTVFCIMLLLAAFIKYLVIRNREKIRVNTKIIMIWFWLPFLLMFGISFRISMFLDRYLIFISSAYYLVLAIAISYLAPLNKFKYIVIGLFVCLFLFTFNPNMDNKRNSKEIVEKVVELKDSNTSVIICPSYFMLNFAYYYNKDIFCEKDNENCYSKMTKRLSDERIFPINSSDLIQYTTKRIIFLDAAANFSFPDNHIYDALLKNCDLKNEYSFNKVIKVFEFERK